VEKILISLATNYNGYTISIILAKSKELARVYWQGANIYPHKIRTITQQDMEKHPTGVFPILKTEETTTSRLSYENIDSVVTVVSND